MKARRRVIGLHAAEAALDHGADKILAVFIDSQRNDSRLMVLVERLAALGIKTQPTQRLRLEQMAEGTPHQRPRKECPFFWCSIMSKILITLALV